MWVNLLSLDQNYKMKDKPYLDTVFVTLNKSSVPSWLPLLCTLSLFQSHQSHLYLQGEDRMFVNLGDNLTKVYLERPRDQLSVYESADMFLDVGNLIVTSTLTGSKQWTVVPIPSAYSGTNWPIRVSWHAILAFIPNKKCFISIKNGWPYVI